METWKPVAQVGDISPDTGTLRVVHDGEGVCLYDLQGEICATQDRCPHGNASLADGYVEDGTIECPLHQARFDIRTGQAMCAPATSGIRVYPVKVEGQDIYADVQG
ncbi:hypothetical protein G6F32_016208 [Rhizopus arrhizus]|nr:hypothetical protein G6F32_016208 [Rhizopus arrhizus]